MEQLSLFEMYELGQIVQEHGCLLSWGELAVGSCVVYDYGMKSCSCCVLAAVADIVSTLDGLRVVLDLGKHQYLVNRSYVDNGSVRLYAVG